MDKEQLKQRYGLIDRAEWIESLKENDIVWVIGSGGFQGPRRFIKWIRGDKSRAKIGWLPGQIEMDIISRYGKPDCVLFDGLHAGSGLTESLYQTAADAWYRTWVDHNFLDYPFELPKAAGHPVYRSKPKQYPHLAYQSPVATQ